MAYSVVFTPEARAQLIALYRYIEIDASLRSHNGSPMRSSTTASAFENCPRVRFAATIYAEAFTSPTIAAAWSLLLRLKVRRCGSLACFTPAKTTKRFYNLNLDYSKRN